MLLLAADERQPPARSGSESKTSPGASPRSGRASSRFAGTPEHVPAPKPPPLRASTRWQAPERSRPQTACARRPAQDTARISQNPPQEFQETVPGPEWRECIRRCRRCVPGTRQSKNGRTHSLRHKSTSDVVTIAPSPKNLPCQQNPGEQNRKATPGRVGKAPRRVAAAGLLRTRKLLEILVPAPGCE